MPGRRQSATARRNLLPRSVFRIPKEYLEVIPIGESLFSPLFQFENALRLGINKHMTTCYGSQWWEDSLKAALPSVYEYAAEHQAKAALTSWIGASKRIPILPIHHLTLGQLEEIVKKYQSDCMPQLFQTMEFFLGHFERITSHRNLSSH